MTTKLLKIVRIFVLVTCIPFISLAQKSDLANWNMNGKVKSIKEISYKAVEKNGEVVKDSIDFYYKNQFRNCFEFIFQYD